MAKNFKKKGSFVTECIFLKIFFRKMTKIRQRKSLHQLFNIQILITYLDYWEFHQGRLSILITLHMFTIKNKKKQKIKMKMKKNL
jgi:hypothetical protein